MLSFISTGSAFNAARGNNSAYLQQGKTLVLLDCGGTIFGSLVKKQLLNKVADIFIVITHTHPDHVGSLGDLILYNQHMLSGQVKIIYPHRSTIETILSAMGVKREYYQFVEPSGASEYKIANQDMQLQFKAYAVTHSANIAAYGYVLKNMAGIGCIYYSGDANEIPAEIRQALADGNIDQLYQDTASYDMAGNPHLSLNKLAQLIPAELRSRVCCMHLDEQFDVNLAEKMGFKVAVSQ